jgi:hypothetical protein
LKSRRIARFVKKEVGPLTDVAQTNYARRSAVAVENSWRTLEGWLHRFKIEKHLVAIEDDQRKSGHVVDSYLLRLV